MYKNKLCSKLLDGGVYYVCNLILHMLASYLPKQISAIFSLMISKTVPFSSSIHTASVRCCLKIHIDNEDSHGGLSNEFQGTKYHRIKVYW